MADKQGIVVAVDLGFTSTSRDRRTPIAYMGHEENVLWCLQPQMESDASYHRGADVSLLSQFSGEQEVVFPPATMFAVLCELGAPGLFVICDSVTRLTRTRARTARDRSCSCK